jgi:hypothetical protein
MVPALMAVKKPRVSAPSFPGKPSTLWAMMSVWARRPSRSGSWKRTARPRGLPLGSLSGRAGMPVEEEKRARSGVEGWVKCGARERAAAEGVGVKVPVRRMPLAWTGGGCQNG